MSESTRGAGQNYLNTVKARTPTAKLFGEYMTNISNSLREAAHPDWVGKGWLSEDFVVSILNCFSIVLQLRSAGRLGLRPLQPP